MFKFFLAGHLLLVMQVMLENDVEANACEDKSTKRFKMLTVLHQDLVVVVVYYTSSESSRGKKGKEFGVVFESIMCAIRIFLLLFFFLSVIGLVEMRLRTESCSKLILFIRALLRRLLLILSGCIFIEVFLVSVLQELIMLSLIISSELRFLPFFEAFPCPIILLIHILSSILFPLLLFVFLLSCFPLTVHIVKIFFSEGIA